MLDRQDDVKYQNLTQKEWDVVDKLKKDDTIMVLPADKDRVTVVMKRRDIWKSEQPVER